MISWAFPLNAISSTPQTWSALNVYSSPSFSICVCCASEQSDLERRAASIGRDLDELRRSGAAGSPEEVVTRLQEYQRAGASRSYLQLIDLDDLDHVALIANEVMPHLAS